MMTKNIDHHTSGTSMFFDFPIGSGTLVVHGSWTWIQRTVLRRSKPWLGSNDDSGHGMDSTFDGEVMCTEYERKLLMWLTWTTLD